MRKFKIPFFTKPKYTRNDWIIDYADCIVQFSSHDGIINEGHFHIIGQPSSTPYERLNLVKNKNQIFHPHTNLQDANTFYDKVTKDLYAHLYVHNYIVRNNDKIILTKKGELMKELGGHWEYLSHRQRELNQLKNQNTINWILAITASLALAVPFIVDAIKKDKPTEIIFNRSIDSLINRQTLIMDSIHKGIDSLISNQKHVIPKEKQSAE